MNFHSLSRLFIVLTHVFVMVHGTIIMGNKIQKTINRDSYTPVFEEHVLVDNLPDGYWVDTFQANDQSFPGLVAYGLATGTIYLHQKILNEEYSYDSSIIHQLHTPVGTDQADINGDGLNDIIICYQYGRSTLDSDPDGGKIVWLENPGNNSNQSIWRAHYVGKSPSMHRLKAGYFTQNKHLEIIGLPVIGKPLDLFSSIPVYLFRQPENVLNVTEWPSELIDNRFFRVIHDIDLIRRGNLDSLLIASHEGINWLFYDEDSRTWTIENLSVGDRTQQRQIGYTGTGGIDSGRMGNDSAAYLATIEPFHGTIVAVYTKDTQNYLTEIGWNRHIVDVYGKTNAQGEGPAHHVVTADFDNDGNDEFLVALRGPAPHEGVYLYKALDLSAGLFAKWKVSDTSASRIAVADFDRDGLLDFATLSYNVPGYFLARNPSTVMFYNRHNQIANNKQSFIQVSEKNNQLLFEIPRIDSISDYHAVSFLAVNNIEISLEVIPPNSSRYIQPDTYVKVLAGVIMWTDSLTPMDDSIYHTRTAFQRPRTRETLAIRSGNNRIRTNNQGAVVLVFEEKHGNSSKRTIDNIRKMNVSNILSNDYDEKLRQLDFHFHPYNETDHSNSRFEEFELYNLRGFDIRYMDTDERLAFLQFWAAGQDAHTPVHRHENDSFCEIHVSLVNTNDQSGLYFLSNSTDHYDSARTKDSEFQKLVLPSFYEHGPIWDINGEGEPIVSNDNRVLYPWHKWQAGRNVNFRQSFDLWLSLEFNVRFSKVAFSA